MFKRLWLGLGVLILFLSLTERISLPLAALPATSAISLWEEGQAAQNEGNYYLAIEKYKAALELNPGYLEALQGLAECYFFLDEYQEALHYVEQGKKYQRQNSRLLNLEGRIYIVQGKLEQARVVFNQILGREPNNVDAMTGIALLEIAAGRTHYALKQLEDALTINPTNRVTLLALALIYESLGETAKVKHYLELALRHHANNYLVHYFAGRYYYLKEEFSRSESQLKTALALQGLYRPARQLLGNLYLLQNKYQLALEVLRPLLSDEGDQVIPRYLLGMAYWKASDLENAVRSFEGALAAGADDEWSRLALEQLALTSLDQKAAKRKSLSEWRVNRGKLFEARNLLSQALLEYRRALKLDPVSVAARLSFATIFKKRGFPQKYLNELEVLKELGLADRQIQEEIDHYQMKQFGTVAAKWKIDQHDLNRRTVSLAVFCQAPDRDILHPLSGPLILSFFKDILDGFSKLKVAEDLAVGQSFEEAFRTARTAKVDYFVMLDFNEAERSFRASLKLYLARTGSLLANFSAERPGNNRIRDTLIRLGEQLEAALPIKGVLLQKQFERGVIDLGSMHQIKVKDELLLVKAGKTSLRNDLLGFNFNDADVVGKIIIENVDEAISEGTLQKKSFYDYISVGDEVLMVPKDFAQQKMQAQVSFKPLQLLEDLINLK